jgi:hypothetical protein
VQLGKLTSSAVSQTLFNSKLPSRATVHLMSIVSLVHSGGD